MDSGNNNRYHSKKSANPQAKSLIYEGTKRKYSIVLKKRLMPEERREEKGVTQKEYLSQVRELQ